MLDQKKDLQFQEMIDVAYLETSTSLMNILLKKYKLMDHFNALRRYLLLGQGDFIRHLMDLMESVEFSFLVFYLILINLCIFIFIY